MTERNQRFMIWAGFAFGPIFFVGFWVVARFIPPPAPGMTAHQVFEMYAQHRTRIQIGLWISTACAPLLGLYWCRWGASRRRCCRTGVSGR